MDLHGTDLRCSSWGAGCLAMLLSFAGKWSHDLGEVCSLLEHRAENGHLHSLFHTSLLTPMPGNSTTRGTNHSSCNHGVPQTMLSHLGFFPSSPLRHLESWHIPHCSPLLKGSVCTPLVIIFRSSPLKQVPPAPQPQLSRGIEGSILYTCTFQAVVPFLLVDLQHLFS